MFTGIITGLGRITASRPLGSDESHGKQLTIEAPAGYLDDVQLGDSIALNGACMTVTNFDASAGRFTIDISQESLTKTAGLADAGPVNLEKAMRANDRLGGHIVQGHVDGVGTVLTRTPGEHWEVVRIGLPPQLARYVVEKGSIAVDGVSLTVSAVSAVDDAEPWFEVSLIPTTLRETTLGTRAPGDPVNLEVDVIAKYVERLLEGRR